CSIWEGLWHCKAYAPRRPWGVDGNHHGNWPVRPPAKFYQYLQRAIGRRNEVPGMPGHAVPAVSDGDDWMALGLEAMQALDYERALTCFDEAVTRWPASHAAWYSRGMAFYHLGDDTAALESFTRASQSQPHSHLAWYGCGVTLAEMGRIDEALEAFERAIALQPDSHLAWL